jgi:AraC family transcriptional regulator
MSSARLLSETQVMRQVGPQLGGLIRPVDWRKILPLKAAASSDRLGWVGMEAARYRTVPAAEVNSPALTHHRLVLVTRSPEVLDLRYEGVKRHVPPAAGSILVMPAGSPVHWRWSGRSDSLHIYLEPELVARVAAEAFELDPARVTVPPIDGLDLPHLRAVMSAVGAELTSRGAGGPLAAESLANVLAVHLIRHVLAAPRPARRRDGGLPRAKLRTVVEYIEGHLDAGPTLEQMAAVARLSPYHFARQFKTATGLPPHQFVIARRVERAKQILEGGGDFPLAQVAARAGFSDQSRFCQHFKRAVGVTPRQFRTPEGISNRPQVPSRDGRATHLLFLMSREGGRGRLGE